MRSLEKTLALLPLILMFTDGTFGASNFQLLHSFGASGDGAALFGSVALDKKGNVYGTTMMGGADGYGTVFKLHRNPDGQWSERILQHFRNGDPNGQQPAGWLIFDAVGNLYGTTLLGGLGHAGTVFEMTPGPTGWTFNVIYTFCSQPDCADGGDPWAGVVFDKSGNLYGTAFNVFELTPGPDGWSESVLYNFCSQPDCTDGRQPYAGVILDAKGNVYGTTQRGGTYGRGVVYKVRHMPDGTWKQRVLHNFNVYPDGGNPGNGLLALDAAGSLYGTTAQGGKYACGIVGCGILFRLTPQPNGHWKETILHYFKPGKGGNGPAAGVVIDSGGNLYGTTAGGGDTNCDCGVVYKLAPNPDGTWSYSVLHRFKGSDGYEPGANLIFDDQGNLYGTTLYGGPGGGGVVFKLTP